MEPPFGSVGLLLRLDPVWAGPGSNMAGPVSVSCPMQNCCHLDLHDPFILDRLVCCTSH